MLKRAVWFGLALGWSFVCQAIELDRARLESLYSSNPKAFVEYVTLLQRDDASKQLSVNDAYVFSYYQGYAAFVSGDYAQTEAAYQQVLQQGIERDYQYRALIGLVNLYQHQGKFYQAFSHGLQFSDSKYDEVPAPIRATGMMAMALALTDSGLLEEASGLLNKYDVATMPAKVRCASLYLRAQIHYKSVDEQVSLQSLEEENQRCVADQQRLYALLTEHALAVLEMQRGDYQAALQRLSAKEIDVKALGYANLVLGWLAAKVEVYEQLRDPRLESALAALAQALPKDPRDSAQEILLMAYKNLASGHRKLGHTEQALMFLDAYIVTYQEAYNRQLGAALAYHAALMQAARRRQEISELNNKTHQLELQNELAKAEAENNRLYLIVISVLLLFLLSILVRINQSRAKLSRRVTYDPLTHAYSREHFEQQLEKVLKLAKKSQREVGFVLFDLDFFKSINDQYGHQAGDWVLQQVAAVAREALGAGDALGRLGGEEFAILLVDCSPAKALQLAEHVRAAIAAIDTTELGPSFSVTASFGVACATKANYHARNLIGQADERLYQAKAQGRNCVRPELELAEHVEPPATLD